MESVPYQPHHKFYYDQYWGTWSRVLRDLSGPAVDLGMTNFVEVNLTPIMGRDDWSEHVWPLIIRGHSTLRGRTDILTNTLPGEVMLRIRNNVPLDILAFLFNYDFLPEIDWDLYRKHTNGGCAFEKCHKRSVATKETT